MVTPATRSTGAGHGGNSSTDTAALKAHNSSQVRDPFSLDKRDNARTGEVTSWYFGGLASRCGNAAKRTLYFFIRRQPHPSEVGLPECNRDGRGSDQVPSGSGQVGNRFPTGPVVGALTSATGIVWSTVTACNTDELKEHQMATTMIAISTFFLTFCMQKLLVKWSEDLKLDKKEERIAHLIGQAWKATPFEIFPRAPGQLLHPLQETESGSRNRGKKKLL